MLYVNQVYIGEFIMLSLKNIMRANASSCLIFGCLFALLPNQVAHFLGGASPAPHSYILIIGVLLILNALHLLWESRASLPPKNIILYFSIGDYIWVIGSIVLIISGLWITTSAGILAASVVAVVVAAFAVLQMRSRKAMGSCSDD